MDYICNFLCSRVSLLLINLIKLIAFRLGYQLVGADQMVVPKGSAAFDRQEAQQYGLNEAIILAEMRGWIAYNAREGKQTHRRDGVYWLYNSPAEWRERHFPWWSEATIRRTLDELAANGLATWRAYGQHNARRWWTVGQVDSGTLQFAISTLQPATHTYPESSSNASSTSSSPKPTTQTRARTNARATRKGAVAVFQGSQTPGEIPVKAERADGHEGFDREGAPLAGTNLTPNPSPWGEGNERRETPSPSCAAPLPQQSLTPNPSPGGEGSKIPAWMRGFWDGATETALQHLLQKYGEGRLMAAKLRSMQTDGIRNRPGFALHLLEKGLITDAQVWQGTPGEDADTQPDVIEPVEADEDATDEQFVIPDDVRQAWAITLSQLEMQFDRGQFASCIQGARLVDVAGDVLVVEARSAYARDSLQHRLYRDVRRVLWDITGNKQIEIKFVVKGEDWREDAQEAEAA